MHRFKQICTVNLEIIATATPLKDSRTLKDTEATLKMESNSGGGGLTANRGPSIIISLILNTPLFLLLL